MTAAGLLPAQKDIQIPFPTHLTSLTIAFLDDLKSRTVTQDEYCQRLPSHLGLLCSEIAAVRPNLRNLVSGLCQLRSVFVQYPFRGSFKVLPPPPLQTSFLCSISDLPYIQPASPDEAERLINAVIKVLLSQTRNGDGETNFDEADLWVLGFCCSLLARFVKGLDKGSGQYVMQLAAVCKNLCCVFDGVTGTLGEGKDEESSIRACQIVCIVSLSDVTLHVCGNGPAQSDESGHTSASLLLTNTLRCICLLLAGITPVKPFLLREDEPPKQTKIMKNSILFAHLAAVQSLQSLFLEKTAPDTEPENHSAQGDAVGGSRIWFFLAPVAQMRVAAKLCSIGRTHLRYVRAKMAADDPLAGEESLAITGLLKILSAPGILETILATPEVCNKMANELTEFVGLHDGPTVETVAPTMQIAALTFLSRYVNAVVHKAGARVNFSALVGTSSKPLPQCFGTVVADQNGHIIGQDDEQMFVHISRLFLNGCWRWGDTKKEELKRVVEAAGEMYAKTFGVDINDEGNSK